MKKSRLFLIFVLCFLLCSMVGAENTAEILIFEYPDEQITITFVEATSEEFDELEMIADCLAYGTTQQSESSVQPRALCWLTGHDLVTRTTIVIQHKVFKNVPRCFEEYHDVTTCTKCDDYFEDDIVASGRILCCPEE